MMIKKATLSEITKEGTWIGLGIAGNQPGHLDQAGEGDDFKNIAADEHAPKGMFPWYVPNHESFLGACPLSNNEIRHNGEACLQPEPEVGLVVEFDYSNDAGKLLDSMRVIGFTAVNDCSRRLAADKISMKKNWGDRSQGMAKNVYLLEDFQSAKGSISEYRLASYLRRNDVMHTYGKDTAVVDYTYFDQQLVEWMTSQINNQKDEGPLESFSEILGGAKHQYGVIAIGATAYEDFGNSAEKFLRVGDEVFVAVYDSSVYSSDKISSMLADGSAADMPSVIMLHQTVV